METLYVDCLGCLMDALHSGKIDEASYNAIFQQQAEIAKMKRDECPQCHDAAYVSMYNPDLMHCPACGVYSVRTGNVVAPFRQGRAIEKEEAA